MFKKKGKKKEEVQMHKIIIVGRSGVGKTALTLRYMYGDFVDCLGYDFDPTFSYRKVNLIFLLTI